MLQPLTEHKTIVGQVEKVNLAGIFLPVTTPFDPVTGDIDTVAFRANLRCWFRSPIRGILIAGSTGESVFLDDDERSTLIEAARQIAPGEAVVIAGTGSESTHHTIRLTRRAANAGADVVLVSPPSYYKGAMTAAVLTRHFKTVADASPVPVVVYQVPTHLSTLNLPTDLIEELSRHPNITGIKDSRGRLELVGELIEHSDEDFQVMVGNGALLYAGLETGAVGGIVATGLIAPAGAVEISVAFQEGRSADAARIQERIAPVHQQIVSGMGVPGVKAALDLLGLRGGIPRPPLGPISGRRIDEIREILTSAELLAATDA